MGLSKLRPVGSRVPLPTVGTSVITAPWTDHYESTFVNSGTAALSLAVKLSVDSRKAPQVPEVIISAYGCPDLVAAVVAQGARPVLVDMAEARPWMNLDAVENALTDNTVGIVAAGFLGIPERLAALRRVADKAGISLIEDSAQMFPPASSGNGLADYVVLSFGRGKPINLMGGGALLIRQGMAEQSADMVAELPRTKVLGSSVWLFKRWLFNFLLTRPMYGVMERFSFLGIGQTVFHPLESISRQVPVDGLLHAGMEGYNNRKDNSSAYSEVLAELTRQGWALLPVACSDGASLKNVDRPSSTLLRYPLLAPSRKIRDKALLELNRNGIGASTFYGKALPSIEGVGEFVAVDVQKFPGACDFAERLITLPTHEDVCTRDIHAVAEVLLGQY
ncbi:DegT/DnrJ/EryC1/StrS family aminotransferase [Marinobacter changyiensis]|uniref:DegT/DnrJ/EryC1/StrS family aminotransferase n=1 Tax=Marinobacter changyiensis TaxID=2604091 RepID=UPI0012642759|nr:DegT/DnrJ/EryC1/StrS family aminotransferase [Marinobacter changyiensis]